MKKVLAVLGILLPFVFGILWLISFIIFLETSLEPTSMMSLGYFKFISMIMTAIGIITMIIGIVYLGKQKPTHKEIIPSSRKLSRKNLWKFALGIGFLFVLQIIQSELSDPTQQTSIIILVFLFVIWIVYAWIDFGLKSMSLSLYDQKKVRTTDVFVNPKKFFRYFIAFIISWVFTVIGIIFFIIPGIIISLRLKMIPYLILEKNLEPWQAIKQSWKMTKGYISNLFVLNILLGFINILGALALIVGLFWTIPLYYLANVSFYKKVLQHNKLDH